MRIRELVSIALFFAGCTGDTINKYYSTPDGGSAGGGGANGGGGSGASVGSAGGDAVEAGGGGTGGDATVPPECVVFGDCPGVDGDCRSRTCVDGVCGVRLVAADTVLPEQTVGDCSTFVCDGAGNVVLADDASDVIDDGNDCTRSVCSGGTLSHQNSAEGSMCTSSCLCPPCREPDEYPRCMAGLCIAGTCVDTHPVRCRIGGATYVGCDGTGTSWVISWVGGRCDTSMSVGYCVPGSSCRVTNGGVDRGIGTCI